MVLELVGWCSDREATVFLDGAEHGSFESREGKIEIRNFGMGKFVGVRVAILGTFGDGGTTRVGKAEDFGDFVEAFADGIVAGSADDFELIVGGHVDNLGVTT